MGFQLYESKTDRIRFISTTDSAVVRDTPEQIANCDKYLDTLDEGLLTLRDKPFVWIFRSLTANTLNIARRNSAAAQYGNFIDLPTATELFRLSVESVENWPKEYPQLADNMIYEFGGQVLTKDFVARIPTPVIQEAAHVLLQSLFSAMPNEPRGKGELQATVTPKN